MRIRLHLTWLTAAVTCCTLLTACGVGDGDTDVNADGSGAAVGSSLVIGNVRSFGATSAGGRVRGAVGGASVRLEGPAGRSATTDDDDGAFLLVALPAGQYRLLIASGGVLATYEPLVVGSGVLVDLGSVDVSADGTVIVESQSASPVLTPGQTGTGGPATVDLEGTWVGAEGDGEMFAFTLKEANGSVVGIMANSDSDGLVDGSISGNTLALIVDYQNGVIDDWRGTVSGNTMSGTWVCNEGDSGTWSATRQ